MHVTYDLSHLRALRLNAKTFPPTQSETLQFSRVGIQICYEEALDSRSAHQLASTVDALLLISAKVPADAIDGLERCRVIARYGSGTDNVDVARATERGILVTNVPDFCLSEVADHTMALLLATARKLRQMDQETRRGHWQARVREPVRRIAGRTLGLIGFGRIAQQVARRAKAFDLDVAAYDPFLDRSSAQGLSVREVGFENLLRQSDFISLHLPLTAATHHLIGEKELREMKREAVLINVSRGGLVDEPALARALSEGRLAGAGIDVYEHLAMFDLDPPNSYHPFFELENVILTPHSAGCSKESLQQLMSEGAREAITVLSGQRPRNWVNPDVVPRFAFRGVESTGE